MTSTETKGKLLKKISRIFAQYIEFGRNQSGYLADLHVNKCTDIKLVSGFLFLFSRCT
jgi:hypothetical protein